MNSRADIKHFYSRFGFGLSFKGYRSFLKSGKFDGKSELEKLLRGSEYAPLSISKEIEPMKFKEMASMSKTDRKDVLKDDRKQIIKINAQWIAEMAGDSDPLREKMSLFWHDHFACKPNSAFTAASYLELLREESLGNFRSLLHGIAKEPAMLLYLNNKQNRKGSPNENFAREVMELFTLGIGNYSENDIKESARAFTGWTVGPEKEFILNKRQHDFGRKTFFGESKNWSGEEIIDRILQEQKTAEYVSGKIAKHFLGKAPDADLQANLTRSFYASDYEIAPLLRLIAASADFRSGEVVGQDVFSPVEILVRMERDLNLEVENDLFRLGVQKGLGQVLFQPPNVAGWPSGKGWIDASTLPVRLSMARSILLKKDYSPKTKKSFAKGEDLAENLKTSWKKGLKVEADIADVEKEIGDLAFGDQVQEIAHWLLPDPLIAGNEMIEEMKLLNLSGTKEALALVASLPEYQLK